MPLTDEQKGVAKGALAGLAIILAAMAFAVMLLGPKFIAISWTGRYVLSAASLLAPALALAFSIGRLANHRFGSPQDIAGSAASGGSSTAMMYQSLLQNTLEQAVLALLAYPVWGILAPEKFLVVLPTAAVLFLLGRALFFIGYARGAGSRAPGFALTFYPTIALILGDLGFVMTKALAMLHSAALP
jgi:hypothetical protein